MILFLILITGCQSNKTLSWGEPFETENVEVIPINIQTITEAEYLTEFGQEIVVDIELKNTSDKAMTINRDFYYYSFGVLHTEEVTGGEDFISRMDLDLFPFDVYTGELEKGQSVETQLIIYTGPGEVLELVFDAGGGLEDENYDVSWKLD